MNHHIQSIDIKDLFGRYTYRVPSSEQTLFDVNIIYALNGKGKTTLLRLVFHLLSPLDNRGHRTEIANTPFSELTVILNDGTEISAKKDKQLLVGPTKFFIKRKGASKGIEWNFLPNSESSFHIGDLPPSLDLSKLPKNLRFDVTRAVEQRTFFEEIKKLRVKTYMLTSDRILQGDSVEEVSDNEFRAEVTRRQKRLSDIVLEHRVASVNDALSKASDWLRTKIYEGSYGGGQSASSLYQDVVKKIAKTTYRTKAGLNKSQEEKVVAGLRNNITDLERRSRDLAALGFLAHTVSSDILPSIEQTKGNRLNLIASILEPYLGGVKAKLDSLTPLYMLVNTFVLSVNDFFIDKKLAYTVFEGIQIFVDSDGVKGQELSPADLSSGEQQLLLLFCHVLTARDDPSVFIIDEPEISLNITWQRMLVSSLQGIAKGANIQFIFASHSMEIITKHRNRVVTLEEH